MAKYGLEFKLMNKGEIAGFFVVDSDGKQLLLSKEKTLKLAESGMLTNWEVVIDEDGEKHLYSPDISLSSIPNSIKEINTTIEIVGKIFKNGEDAGYLCIDSNGNRRSYTHDKVWQLAKMGRVNGIKAEKSNNCRVLLSEDTNLRNIKIYNL